jgi:hypothetical protein
MYLRAMATSHMSQEPWPCNGEDFWLIQRPYHGCWETRIMWSRALKHSVKWKWTILQDHIVYFVGGKREDLVQYDIFQTLSIWEDYLVAFVCPGIYLRICFVICPEIFHVGKIFKKVMVSHNLRQTHLLEVDLTKIPKDHDTLSKVRHVGLHVKSHPWNLLWAFRPSPSCVKRTWTVSALSPMRTLRLQWSCAFNLVCEVTLICRLAKSYV